MLKPYPAKAAIWSKISFAFSLLIPLSFAPSKNDFFSYGGAGVVLVYEKRNSKFSVAYNNHTLGDFDSSFYVSGKNNNGIDNELMFVNLVTIIDVAAPNKIFCAAH